MRRHGIGMALAGTAVALLLMTTAAPAGAAMAISAPASKNLGSAPTGAGTLSAQLGTVSVTASGLVSPSFRATVSGTVFTTGAGSAEETIGKAFIFYWSGPATTASGVVDSGTPGQATSAQAQDLTVSRPAFSATGVSLSISVAWNPTLIVRIPGSAVAGTYSGTITHSVA